MYPYSKKQHQSRAIPALVCVAFLLAATSACARTAPSSDGAASDAVAPSWVTLNPVTLDVVPSPDNVKEERLTISRNWGRVSGLADTAVEQKINDSLYEKYEEIAARGLPPYRGIKARIPEGAQVYRDWMACNISANCNNVLSVCYTRSRIYALPDENGEIVWAGDDYLLYDNTYEQFPLTFDLATGDELSLADMFAGGAEDLKRLDEILLATLRAADPDADRNGFSMYLPGALSIRLLGAYEPIAADQKFSLLNNGNIQLLFDYETPQFDLGYSQTADINTQSFRDRMTLFGRFALPPAEAAALYAAAPPLERELLYASTGKPPAVYDILPPYHEEEYAGIHVSVLFSANSEVPAEIAELLPAMCALTQDEREILASPPAPPLDVVVSIYVRRCGRFFTAERDFALYARKPDGTPWSPSFASLRNWDAESLVELDPDDLFAAGFDYEGLLRDALDAELEENAVLYENGAPRNEASARAEKERLLAGLHANGVNIKPKSMSFVTPPTQTVLSGADGGSVFFVELDYKDIGYENLRLFDPPGGD